MIPVELEANTSYTLSLVGAFGANDQILTEPLTLTFSTGDQLASFGSIEGVLVLVEAASKQADPVEILFGEVIAFNEDGEFSGESAVDEQGGFQIPGLGEGTYNLFAKVETTAGTTSGAYDPDGDDEPDDVDVGPGEAAVLADFTVPLPLVTTEVDLVADDAVTVDFNVANGDDGVTETTVPPGESFEIAVYAKGIVDLLGYEIQVNYDSNAVTLDGVTEDGALESNILKQNGGIAVSLSAPRGDAISFSTVLLGPAASQLGQGNGLLAVLTFLVNDRFSGATDVVVTKVQFSNGVGGVEEVETFTRGTVNVEGLERQITLASSADTISADGVATATLTAALFDLDGLALTDDGLVITFDVVSGDARINGGSALAPSSSNGGASAILTILSEGDVVARATVAGAREATVTVVGSGLPALGEGAVGPMAIDMDTEDGDQGLRILETVPDDGVVTIDLVAISGASGLAGYQFTLVFDATALDIGTFTPSGLFSGALPIPTNSEGLIRGSVAFLGSTQTTGDAGSIGTVTFTVKEGATLPTRVTLSAGQFAASADDQTRLTIGAGGAIVQIGGDDSGEPTPDFDGDGTVGFGDFIQFAQAFGASTGAANFDAKFDLDGNGNIGFPDFITFAGSFGQPANPLTKLGLSNLNADTGVSLAARSGNNGETVTVSVDLSGAEIVLGYGLTLQYDAVAFELADVLSAGTSLFAEDGRPALQAHKAGQVTLADVLADAVNGDRTILELQFTVLDPTVTGVIEIAEAFISDPSGGIRRLGESAAELRALPNTFELTQNYPNPFNPETVIPFALPEASDVRLTIYNVLGQQVAYLVEDRLAAGFHRVTWSGRDEYGRQVASGLYFVRMQASEFNTVRKMMLLK